MLEERAFERLEIIYTAAEARPPLEANENVVIRRSVFVWFFCGRWREYVELGRIQLQRFSYVTAGRRIGSWPG